MGSFFVIIQSPEPGHISYLADAFKQIRIKELSAKRAIEAFNKTILLGLAKLDIYQLNMMSLAPIRQSSRY
ncbi:hypothetical protein SAMN02745781_01448 [Vibrio gazogenes DSM 21264]|uniref:Uncharacterized protein n=1 Tax=Vibrio gazogenes DSM 21264 = NBRC 103151 TaxID=1123492 RepID=A0A1M4YUI7_VIBGA|nr:hypothetical protein SAMN02745781_01448 [Vibrio gazogenes DSM 21264] [Vibrio gazogenes DSM 21264 = NBRC 103151]SJN56390.1 hypothetical protein BQ6471_02018 [Vibrio gazogenes]